jgi:hypothetical protein
MKWMSSMLTAALLLQIGYMPCAAKELVVSDEIFSQNRVKLIRGTRIRVTSPSIAEHRLVGSLAKVGVDSLVLMREDLRRLAVTLASLTKLEVDPGKKPKARFGAVKGMLMGGDYLLSAF